MTELTPVGTYLKYTCPPFNRFAEEDTTLQKNATRYEFTQISFYKKSHDEYFNHERKIPYATLGIAIKE